MGGAPSWETRYRRGQRSTSRQRNDDNESTAAADDDNNIPFNEQRTHCPAEGKNYDTTLSIFQFIPLYWQISVAEVARAHELDAYFEYRLPVRTAE